MTAPPLYFIANPASPHARHWLEYTGSLPVTIFHIPAHDAGNIDLPNAVKTACPLPSMAAIMPATLQYILLGLWLRFFAPASFFHAHNTSGYGLTALLSGKKYGITTYGSEIFSMPSRSSLYRLMIRKILDRAAFITATSQHMKNSVENIIGKSEKINEFSGGVASLFMTPITAKKEDGPLWLSSRRIHPLYRTAELVTAFIGYKENGGKGRLALLEGDSDPDYFAAVKTQAAPCDAIEIISGFIPQSEIVAHLNRASFCISSPDTDQLSSSILEGAARGAVPVLRPLESYKSLYDIAHLIDETGDLTHDFLTMFEQTSALSSQKISGMAKQARQLIEDQYSITSARDKYFILLAPFHKALAT